MKNKDLEFFGNIIVKQALNTILFSDDSLFKTCLALFSQFFKINMVINIRVFSLIYPLMPNKEESCYKEVFWTSRLNLSLLCINDLILNFIYAISNATRAFFCLVE